jgi:hypothetical protein
MSDLYTKIDNSVLLNFCFTRAVNTVNPQTALLILLFL